MKCSFFCMIALLLTLCLLPAVGLAEDADQRDPFAVQSTLDGNYPDSLFTIGDELFALTWSNLFRKVEGGWQPAAEDLFYMTEDGISYQPVGLAAAGSAVYLLSQGYSDNVPDFILMKASLEDGRLTQQEKLFSIDLGVSDYCQFYGVVADEDSVYFLCFCQTDSDWGNNTLYRISLADGKVTKVTRDYLTCLQPYKDGQLLAFYWNQEKAYQPGGEDITPAVVTLDKQTGAMTTLCSLPDRRMGGLAYDSANDFVFVSGESGLYRYDADFGEPTLCAYLTPGSISNDKAGAVANGLYYIGDWNSADGLQAVSTDPSKIPTQVLRLSGYAGYDDDVIRAYAAEHPEVALMRLDSEMYNVETLTQQMISGDNSADIYSIYFGAQDVYTALRNKGYCLDLAGSKVLTEDIARMYPQLTAHLWKGEKLCAVPSQMSANSVGYYAAALEAVGLTEDDLPHTLMELMDFCAMWARDYADEYSDYDLFEFAYDLKQQIFSMILNGQIALCAAQGVPLTFDTPLMQKLMAKLEEVSPVLKSLSIEPDMNGEYHYGGDGPRAIFNTYCSLVPDRYGSNPRWNGQPLVLAMDESVEPAYAVSMSGYLVNPNTKNADLAISYLEFFAQHRNKAAQIALMPDVNEPIENEWYADNIKYMNETLAELEKDLVEQADTPEAASIKETIEMYQNNLKEMEADRWAVSEEQIAAYRELAPHLYADSENLFSTGATEVSTLLQRYLDGQITGDKLIKEMSRILRMIQLEAQ